MCAISGFVTLDGLPCVQHDLDRLAAAVLRGSERGRDSWGVVTAHEQWIGETQGITAEQATAVRSLVPAAWAMCNNRAEPTTEYQPTKTRMDVQPFCAHGLAVAHNGTIANDAALAELYGRAHDTRVDSGVLPGLFAANKSLPLDMAVLYGLKEVVGSYAMAVGRFGTGGQLVLATNYRPLHLVRDERTVHFASQLDYVYSHPELLELPSLTVPPYTLVSFPRDGYGPTFTSLRKSTPRSARALVVCSGGLDSTVAATYMRDKGFEVTLLHFTYGCRAEQREVQAVHAVAEALSADVQLVDVRHLFTQVIGGSPLTNSKAAISDGEQGAEFAHEWVPARNLILMSMAIGIAESHGYSKVVLGNNLEEAGAYPDNEQEFIRLLNTVVPYAVADGVELSLEMPVGTLVKHEIVELGHKLGAPIEHSWSCYEGGDVHCGSCGPCYMRRHAHTMAGIIDPTEYAQ